MQNIKLMNEELKNILMSLPEGVVLVKNSNNEAVLGNIEFCRLFNIPKSDDIEGIKSKITNKTLQIHNIMSDKKNDNLNEKELKDK